MRQQINPSGRIILNELPFNMVVGMGLEAQCFCFSSLGLWSYGSPMGPYGPHIGGIPLGGNPPGEYSLGKSGGFLEGIPINLIPIWTPLGP